MALNLEEPPIRPIEEAAMDRGITRCYFVCHVADMV